MERVRLAGSSADRGAWLQVDADACTLDGRALVTTADWRHAVRDDALGRVEGGFAVAWSSGDGALHVARDAIGHRSVYYAHIGGELVFASKLKDLLDACPIPRRLDARALASYLACAYVPGRRTLVEGAFEVLPGERITFRRGNLERGAFWDLPADPESFLDEDELRRNLRARLERIVQSSLPTGGVAAATLSGGIDSSLVVALAQRFSPEPIFTYSITFGPDYKDELPWSSMVAAHCKTRHSIVELTPAKVLADLDRTIACFDKPNGDPLTVPNALLFRTISEPASVVLNGEGGDPCFGGPKNLPMLLSTLYATGAGADAEDGLAAERDYLRAHLKCFDELGDMLSGDVFAAACSPPLEADLSTWFCDARWDGLVSKLMAINVRFKGGHHILPKVDALSAPFGVVARSPLFAKPLVELAFAIPPQLKLRGADEKYLLKQAVADLLPREILERPKSGMMVPVEGWFQGPLLPEARARILDGLAVTGLFRKDWLDKLVSGKLGGLRPRRGVKIWLLVTLEAHLRALGITG